MKRLKRKLQQEELNQILNDTITDYFQNSSTYAELPSVPKDAVEKIFNDNLETIRSLISYVFPQDINLSDTQIDMILQFCKNTLRRNKFFPDINSGVVIAGFGEDEPFPSVIWFTLEAIVGTHLKQRQEKIIKIKYPEALSSIIPFAQSDMVNVFMEGVHPNYRQITESYFNTLQKGLPIEIVNTIPELTNLKPQRKDQITNLLNKALKGAFDEFRLENQNYISTAHVNPVLEAVAVLPKDELATMAESLVNLTSIKRRISMAAETVGGPIDVAVISKGDGLIWIKRKHYFEKDLNPCFFSNYYKSEQNQNPGGEHEK